MNILLQQRMSVSFNSGQSIGRSIEQSLTKIETLFTYTLLCAGYVVGGGDLRTKDDACKFRRVNRSSSRS